MTALVFMDTETTGLSLEDDIWEFAAIRREPDGTEATVHYFVKHGHLNPDARCKSLPDSFRADHDARYDMQAAIEPWALSMALDVLFDGRPHVVGAVPNFDTERVAALLRRNGHEPGWHYHLIDVENLAVGYLQGVAARAEDESQMRGEGSLNIDRSLAAPPWKSDDLAYALSVTIAEADRHTAMGDARWAMRIYDAVMGGAS